MRLVGSQAQPPRSRSGIAITSGSCSTAMGSNGSALELPASLEATVVARQLDIAELHEGPSCDMQYSLESGGSAGK
eukprot:612327-Amphidinium_carterae.3